MQFFASSESSSPCFAHFLCFSKEPCRENVKVTEALEVVCFPYVQSFLLPGNSIDTLPKAHLTQISSLVFLCLCPRTAYHPILLSYPYAPSTQSPKLPQCSCLSCPVLVLNPPPTLEPLTSDTRFSPPVTDNLYDRKFKSILYFFFLFFFPASCKTQTQT